MRPNRTSSDSRGLSRITRFSVTSITFYHRFEIRLAMYEAPKTLRRSRRPRGRWCSSREASRANATVNVWESVRQPIIRSAATGRSPSQAIQSGQSAVYESECVTILTSRSGWNARTPAGTRSQRREDVREEHQIALASVKFWLEGWGVSQCDIKEIMKILQS